MNMDEILETNTKEYAAHLNGLKDSLRQLNADKAFALGNHTEVTAPDIAKDKIERDKKAWQKEWGIYGSRIKDLVQKHQKGIYDAYRKQDLVKDLTAANDKNQQQKKQNGRGR